jgi:hypothetical protein
MPLRFERGRDDCKALDAMQTKARLLNTVASHSIVPSKFNRKNLSYLRNVPIDTPYLV